MSAPYTPRGYQKQILDRIDELRGTNILLELDCGLGKRFITHQIVAERNPDLRFIIVANSSASRDETVDYMTGEYGGLEEELGEVSSRIPYSLRPRTLKEKRVIVTTPTVLAGQIAKRPGLMESFDAVLINEVDTIVRRRGGKRVLVKPWPELLVALADKWLIGMSGTLRDEHVVVRGRSVSKTTDLDTLKAHFPDAVVLHMEELEDSDIGEHMTQTTLQVVRVEDRQIRSISIVLDELIRQTRGDIIRQCGRSDATADRLHLMLEQLDIPEGLKAAYQSLIFVRKYLFAMPPWKILRFLGNRYTRRFFNLGALRRQMPRVSKKVWKVRDIALRERKTVVLSSFLDMVSSIQSALEEAGLEVFVVTGQVMNKGAVLRDFKEYDGQAALVMSSVGERDLDIGDADTMIVCDAIKTEKTMYQRVKRTRGGKVIFLVFANTSEERSVRNLVQKVIDRYSWSCVLAENT